MSTIVAVSLNSPILCRQLVLLAFRQNDKDICGMEALHPSESKYVALGLGNMGKTLSI